MSDANVPLPREPDSSETRGDHSSEWEVPSPWMAKSKPEPMQNHQDWQTVNFPNAINVDNIPPAAANDQSTAAANDQSTAPAPMATTHSSAREVELLKLVGDLNQCNDNLLRRIAQLEETLEHSQAALQAEIERSQEPGITPEQPPPPASSPNAQIAQLVSELDSTQQALKRQRILTETLQAQLETSQQRVAQLERECALIQQRYTKQSQTVMETEATCRDLRSRLQRQQHYTLQFKAALEKSLEMSSHSGQSPLSLSRDNPNKNQQVNRGVPSQLVSMPKAQRIQPWSADANLSKQAPNLDVLIKGLSPSSPHNARDSTQSIQQSGQQSPIPSPYPLASASSQLADQPDSEAEALLWRDMERLIDGSRKRADEVEPPSKTADQSVPPPILDKLKDKQTEISSKLPSQSLFRLNPTAASAASQAEEPKFTEPSPWGEPLKEAQSQSPTKESASAASAANQSPPVVKQSSDSLPLLTSNPPKPSVSIPVAANQTVDYPPALNPQLGVNSPSPIVYPLRPQRKIKSLAAVELPNFPRQQTPKS